MLSFIDRTFKFGCIFGARQPVQSVLSTSRGIVFHVTDYSETSIIARIFTEQYGLQSFIVKGVRKPGARIKRNLFGPLSPVELVWYRKENAGLNLLKEISPERPLNGIAADITKSSVLLFMNELLNRSVGAEMPDLSLFSFIHDAVMKLDETGGSVAMFPIRFALALTGNMGFAPHANFSDAMPVFDLMEGCFVAREPLHSHCMVSPWSDALALLLEDETAEFSHETRVYLLEKLLEYFRLHHAGFGEMKSHHILSTVLRD